MPPIATGPKELDKKLRCIILAASRRKFANTTALATYVRKQKPTEFSYRRPGSSKPAIATVATIEKYVSYAQAIGVLDGNLLPTQTIRANEIESFQQWLGGSALNFLNRLGSSAADIKSAAQALLRETPPSVPTISNIHGKLRNPPPAREFGYSVKLVSTLRPATYRLQSRPVFILKGVLKG